MMSPATWSTSIPNDETARVEKFSVSPVSAVAFQITNEAHGRANFASVTSEPVRVRVDPVNIESGIRLARKDCVVREICSRAVQGQVSVVRDSESGTLVADVPGWGDSGFGSAHPAVPGL